MFRGVPFTRILLAFIAGILVQIWLQPDLLFAAVLFGISFLVYSISIAFSSIVKYRTQFVTGAVLSLVLFSCGLLITYFNTTANCGSYFAKSSAIELYKAKINEEMLEKPNSLKSMLQVKAIKVNGEWQEAKGNVLVYFKKEDAEGSLGYGDEIIFNNQPVIVDGPTNPHQFNYKRYLLFHNTYHQVFLSKDDYLKLNTEKGFDLFAYSYSIRSKLLSILQEHLSNPRENAVAAALVLGYGENIDNELINAYSGAGAMHVLCVSGLHVGIIFIVLSRLLLFMDKKKYLKILKFVLLIVFIWFYALVTGLSPSVSRASTMITLVIIGSWIRGSGGGNIYNTIIVSMFVLLLINPYLITEVGFQLSYLAVFGIIYIHPKLFALFKTGSVWWNRIWEITSVSISAQLATFPLAALYFHKFPSLFMVSNLFVIPTATFIIYGVILLMLVSWLPILASMVAKLLAGVIWFLNEVVLFIEEVPYSVLDGIAWSVAETWLVYGIIVLTIAFLVRKVPLYFQGALVACVALLAISAYKANFISKQNKVLVYDINNTTAIDFVSGNSNYLLANKRFIEDENAIRFNVLQNWFWMGAKNNSLVDVDNLNIEQSTNLNLVNDEYLVFQNKRIAVIGEGAINKREVAPLHLDLLVLKHINYFNAEKLLVKFNPKQVVLDSSWPKWKVKKAKEQLLLAGVQAHAVSMDNAFEWTL